MADAFTQVVQMAQTLEFILEQRYQATGKGLHEKLNSVEDEIPEQARKQIRFVATIRNKSVHENVELAQENLAGITKAYRLALAALDGKTIISDSFNASDAYGRNYDGPQKSRPGKLSLDRPARPQKPRPNKLSLDRPVRPQNAQNKSNAQSKPNAQNKQNAQSKPAAKTPASNDRPRPQQSAAQTQQPKPKEFDFNSLPKRAPKGIEPLRADAPYVPPQTPATGRGEPGVSVGLLVGIIAGLIVLVGGLFFALMSALTSK